MSEPTITTWRSRSKTWVHKPPFPEPAGYLSHVPWWWWDTIEAWVRASGRHHLLSEDDHAVVPGNHPSQPPGR